MEQVVEKVKCSICGREYWKFPSSANSSVDKYMEKFGLCHECAFFSELKDHPHKYGHVIEDCYYDIYTNKKNAKKRPGVYLGSGGAKWRLLLSDGSAIISNDVWLVGKIPPRFILDFPQDAWKISPHAYKIMKEGQIFCKRKGCYDRYRCYLYDIRQEFEAESFNNIPSEWTPGESGCPSFVSIVKDIKGYWNINEILKYINYEKEEIQSNKNGDGRKDERQSCGKRNRKKSEPFNERRGRIPCKG